jgi:hypothetical protein
MLINSKVHLNNDKVYGKKLYDHNYNKLVTIYHKISIIIRSKRAYKSSK